MINKAMRIPTGSRPPIPMESGRQFQLNSGGYFDGNLASWDKKIRPGVATLRKAAGHDWISTGFSGRNHRIMLGGL